MRFLVRVTPPPAGNGTMRGFIQAPSDAPTDLGYIEADDPRRAQECAEKLTEQRFPGHDVLVRPYEGPNDCMGIEDVLLALSAAEKPASEITRLEEELLTRYLWSKGT